MAKVSFNKLNLKVNINEVPVQIGEETIAVKQYLPLEEKLELITNVIESAHDIDINYANPMKIDVYLTIEIIKKYTDISFTEKQLENIPALYDKFISAGAWDIIRASIPEVELSELIRGAYRCGDAFYAYRNSIMGILDTIKQDYSDMDLNAQKIKETLTNKENMEMIETLLTKLN